MGDEMGIESPVLRQNLGKNVTKEKGPGYGEPLTDLDKLPKWLKVSSKVSVPLTMSLLLLVASGEITRSITAADSESGPNPRVLPAPEEITREMRGFDEKIKEINQEPRVFVAQTTPSPSEIQQKAYQEEHTPSLVSIRDIRFVSEEEMERVLINERSELSLSQHSSTFFEHSPDQVREIDLALDAEIKERAENLLQQIDDEVVNLNPKTDEFRDFYIYAYHNGLIGKDALVKYLLIPDSEQLYLTLAGHEIEYIRNPLIQRAATDLGASGAMKAINMILKENVSSSLFN